MASTTPLTEPLGRVTAVKWLIWSARRLLTGSRYKSVVLVGRLDGDLPETDETWGCNFAYRTHAGLDRLYAMDPPEDFHKAGESWWFAEADALGIPVVMQYPVGDIRQSCGFDRDGFRKTLGLDVHHQGSVAYMLADAIREGFGTIVLHRMLERGLSEEYYEQKDCLDMLAALAAGLGIRVLTTGNSLIARPHPWQSEHYGYETHPRAAQATRMITDTVRDIVTGRGDPGAGRLPQDGL